jgi:hypothetical protein
VKEKYLLGMDAVRLLAREVVGDLRAEFERGQTVCFKVINFFF